MMAAVNNVFNLCTKYNGYGMNKKIGIVSGKKWLEQPLNNLSAF